MVAEKVYLEELSKLGVYGTTSDEVALTFIRDGIIRAMEKGIIKPKKVQFLYEKSPTKEGK